LAQQFAGLSQDDDLVLLADGQVVASTLRNDDSTRLVPAQFAQLTARGQIKEGIADEQFTLNEEH